MNLKCTASTVKLHIVVLAAFITLHFLAGKASSAGGASQIEYSPREISLPEFNSRFIHDYPKQGKLEANTVQYLDKFIAAYGLEESEKKRLLDCGMVVSERACSESFGNFYFSLYHEELPVLITTDAILFALHTTYDSLLADMERVSVYPSLANIVEDMHRDLKAHEKRFLSAGIERQNIEDLDIYLAVAKRLLFGEKYYSELDTGNLCLTTKSESDKILDLVASIKQTEFQLFGTIKKWNFGAFEPMGHYRKNEILEGYWRSMVWLRMADFTLSSERERVDALLLIELLKSVAEDYFLIESIIDLLVGKSDRLTLLQIDSIANALQFNNLKTRVKNHDRLWHAISSDESNRDQIPSKIYNGRQSANESPYSTITTGLFGRRWVLDAYVTQNTVYDKVEYKDQVIERTIPSGLDIAFALGNDRAALHLQEEFADYPYFHNLAALRDGVDSLQIEFWNQSFYNSWLGALRDLNISPDDMRYPPAMRTKEWQDKMLNTQLCGLTQVRHANQLYNPPTMGGIICDFPLGYIEPYPDFYHRLNLLAQKWNSLLEKLSPPKEVPNLPQYVVSELTRDYSRVTFRATKVFAEWETTMTMLEEISVAELEGRRLNEGQTKFLKDVMEVAYYEPNMCGAEPIPRYSGWYPKLFYPIPGRCSIFKPLVVAAGYDPGNKTYLEMATGMINTCLVVIEVDGKPVLFAGPVGSYYEFTHKGTVPLDDDQWKKQVVADRQGKLPVSEIMPASPLRTAEDTTSSIERPGWMDSFLVRSHSKQVKALPREKILLYLYDHELAEAGIEEAVVATLIIDNNQDAPQFNCGFLNMKMLDLVMPKGTPEGFVDLEVSVVKGVATDLKVTRSSDKKLESLATKIIDDLGFLRNYGPAPEFFKMDDNLKPKPINDNRKSKRNELVIQKNGETWGTRFGTGELMDEDKLELRVRFDKITPLPRQ